MLGLDVGELEGDADGFSEGLDEGDDVGIAVGCDETVGAGVVGDCVGFLVPHRVDPDLSELNLHAVC